LIVLTERRMSNDDELEPFEGDDLDPEAIADLGSPQSLRDRYDELAGLAGMLAHEVKNPLSVIRMNMELLAEDMENVDTPEARRAKERITTVNRQCVRLETLLADFLRFSRMQHLELKTGSLNDQINHVLDFYEPTCRRQKIEIKRYLESDLPLIRLESQTLQAALINLVKNAIEAMPDGGQLVVRTRTTRTGVALDLIDTGTGIDHKTLLNMFKTFYTNKEGGSGLGLPMARKIIEAHGGRINVESAMGHGTQFTLEFPTLKRI
jgi:signal transduction histidine kinase